MSPLMLCRFNYATFPYHGLCSLHGLTVKVSIFKHELKLYQTKPYLLYFTLTIVAILRCGSTLNCDTSSNVNGVTSRICGVKNC